ncbi:MAG: hypothetical protein OXP70_14745, partial [Acidobacteriota bacterium]|nr:hypothetical protein [Acidobacteriota bacterium]
VALLRDATRAVAFLRVFFLADRRAFFFITVLFTLREEPGKRKRTNETASRCATRKFSVTLPSKFGQPVDAAWTDQTR